jgi:hypothetical protein
MSARARRAASPVAEQLSRGRCRNRAGPAQQVDEVNLPGRPRDCELATEAVNRLLDAVPARPAVHVCFGNYGGGCLTMVQASP